MKYLDEYIDVVTVFEKDRNMPLPIKFKLRDKTIVIRDIISTDVDKTCGIMMYIYKCKSIVNNREVHYELKYELSNCKWRLYKIDN